MKAKRLTLKDHKQETKLFHQRCLVAIMLVALFALCIVARLGYLQIFRHHFYTTLSKHNLLNIIPTAPNRGLIYDRNGVLLAENIPVYTLAVIPGLVKHLKSTVADLRKILPTISDEDIENFWHSVYQHRRFDQVPLKYKLTEQQIAKFYVNHYRFPGVLIQTKMLRHYPLGAVTSDVVGYVGRINATELNQINNVNYSASAYIGKRGIEKQYEQLLHGTVGAEEVETNARGRVVRILKRVPAVAGSTIYLSIDSKLQAYAEKALGDNNGAIVAIDPSNGQVLALVSHPSYDPNEFVTGMSNKQYQQLLHADGNPLFNRAIRGQYAPGSTIKPFIALGGLSEGVINPQYKIYDPGWFQLPNTKHIYHDWKHTGHGWVNFYKAIMVSCDTYFYNLAVNLGIDRLDTILKAFGFGQATNLDIPFEVTGIVPSPTWKLSHQAKPWYTGDTVITGIGQGSLLATPIQLASAVATIAEHGSHFQPTLLLKTIDASGNTMLNAPTPLSPVVLSSPDIWDEVIAAMKAVIFNPYGTAVRFGRHPPYTAAAKTGTAQVYGKQRDEENIRTTIPKRLRNNHLFIVFAPIKQPKIALAVVIEHAGAEDRIARKVLDFYFKELQQESTTHEHT